MSKMDGHGVNVTLPDGRPVEALPAGKEGCRGKGKCTKISSDTTSPCGVLLHTDNLNSDENYVEREDANLDLTGLENVNYSIFKVDEKTSLFIGRKVKLKCIEEKFRRMKQVADERLVFYDPDKREFVRIGKSSRWSGDGSEYQKGVIKKLSNQTRGLRRLSMVTLTFDKQRIREIAKKLGWSFRSDEDLNLFILRYGADMVGHFAKCLRIARKRKGLRWNFVAWAMELFNKEGGFHPHFHLIFYGGWVANLADLQRLWPYSDPQHVDVKGMRSNNVAKYISKYVGKGLHKLCDAGNVRIAAFIWYFKRRLHQCRFRSNKGDEDEPVKEKRNLIYVGFESHSGLIRLSQKFIEEFDLRPSDEVLTFDQLLTLFNLEGG
jgi:hypothetical protein